MKNILTLIVAVLISSCSGVVDCFQSAGSTVQEEIMGLASFSKIVVNRDVELILAEGPVSEVIVTTGTNLREGVSVVVVDGELILSDDNTCNFTRDYNITKVFVTAPNITRIRSATQFAVRSQGLLNYPELQLISEDDSNSEFNNVGDFYLDLNTESLSVVNNNHSNYFISGSTNMASILFYSGNGRFEGANFIAEEVRVYHRGYNDMIVYPLAKISGEIRSTGDVRAQNQPSVVDIQEFYTGRLIFD
jgi:hypothetical protein